MALFGYGCLAFRQPVITAQDLAFIMIHKFTTFRRLSLHFRDSVFETQNQNPKLCIFFISARQPKGVACAGCHL